MKRVLSLGAGVQSSTLALMIEKGELPSVDCAIFADTVAEPQHVYDWLDWLETRVSYPIHRVIRGSLRDDIYAAVSTGSRVATPPVFVKSEGGGGLILRQCTTEYKIQPIIAKLREVAGIKKGARYKEPVVEQLIGISLDEAIRMKPSRNKWLVNTWPLIDLRMSRSDCLLWMERNGYPMPQKSSCTFCPYHSDLHWRELKMHDPESWRDAVEVDRALRSEKGLPGLRGEAYLHRSLIPLEEVDFRNAEDMGQGDLFGEECEGMCGV